MRHGCDVTDDGKVETDRLERADGRFTAGAWSPNEHFDFLEAVAHGLARGILRHHLRGIGSAFARAFEAHFTGTGSAN